MLTTDLGGSIRRRSHLRERGDVRFVERGKFLELLVSTRRLERRDDRSAGLRGLHDPEAGLTYVIADTDLRPVPLALADPADRPIAKPSAG
jgi:hypothetical protein